jgi:site-specific DNA-cytosine methylase
MHISTPDHRTIKHAHLFCGIGGGARGFNRAAPRVGNLQAHFRCPGGIDVDPAAVRDFARMADVAGTCLDLFDREQYAAFHGSEPPTDWRQATTADIHAAFGHENPDIVFLSAPCKGFSGLLSETKSKTAKYQALNRLTLRGVWLTLEAYANTAPVPLILFENVPRIATRGRVLLDQITALLRSYGYAVAETTHDCGELGGLAQSRKRFLLVARHMATVPPFLYEAPRRALRGVGDVLGRLLLPGDLRAGPMHRVPSLQWQTWVRLAFVKAGADWRSLASLRVEDGKLADYALAPDTSWHNGALGVTPWAGNAGTVTAGGRVGQGSFSVADPRRQDDRAEFGQYGVKRWDQPSQVVIGKAAVGAGQFAVADPRHQGAPKFNNIYRVVPWSATGPTVTGGKDMAVADSRTREAMFHNAFRTVPWNAPSQAITGQHAPTSGAMCVADPRSGLDRVKGDNWYGAGHFGVLPWDETSGTVSAAAKCDNGSWSIADPRLPEQSDRLVAVIRALDGTWHRPFTTLELASLQSLVDPEEHLELEGLSDAGWRERIGNAVPPESAQAIAETMGAPFSWHGAGPASCCRTCRSGFSQWRSRSASNNRGRRRPDTTPAPVPYRSP